MPVLKLHEGEEKLLELHPHPVSFWRFYVICFYLIGLSVVMSLAKGYVTDFVGSLPFLSQFPEAVFLAFWWLVILVPALIIAVVWISWKQLIGFIALGSVMSLMYLYFNVPETYVNLMPLAFGLISIFFIDMFRRGHRYYLTDQRIVLNFTFPASLSFTVKLREIRYSDVTDILISRGLIGRIFNYATIFPVTASGMGLGQELAFVSVGAGGSVTPGGPGAGVAVTGGRTITVPRGRTSYILFGVPNSGDVYDRISTLRGEYEETRNLKRIAEGVTDLKKAQESKREG